MRSLRDAELDGKRVLMRVDFNVPTDKEGKILDDAKIISALPSIKHILGNNSKLILMSHLGRPKGKRDEKYSLKPVASYLDNLLKASVNIAEDCVGDTVKKRIENMKNGDVLLLENLRFHPEEEENDADFSKELAALGDVYINDAFGTAHRAHASTVGITDYLPAYAGFLMENEVKMLSQVINSPERPRMAILGGAKVTDKLGLISNLLDKMDVILIGGGMANTFLKAKGKNIGRSLYEKDLVAEAASLFEKARQKKVKLFIPIDVVITGEIAENAKANVVNVDEVPDNMMIVDIGPNTLELYQKEISQAKTIIWNGPMGVYEYEQFAAGSLGITLALAHSPAVSVIGGGDSAVIAHDMGLEDKITHISTGGGATLEFLEGIQLPGVLACGG
ncbi:MAG: phosphoglycerate kinase [Syntrophomonadaceae bacterium]